jgi:hypothetical protein
MNQAQMQCPLGDRSRCKIQASLELSGGRGIVQANCQACGHGQSINLPLAEALELHDELHRHTEPPKAAMTSDESAGGGEAEPATASNVQPPVEPPPAPPSEAGASG